MKSVKRELGKRLIHPSLSCRKLAAILGQERSFLTALPFLSSGHKKRRVRDKGQNPPLKFKFAATRVLEPTAGNLEAVRDPDS